MFLLLFRHVRSVGGLKKIVAIAKSRDRYSPKIVKTANQVCLSPAINNNNEYEEKVKLYRLPCDLAVDSQSYSHSLFYLFVCVFVCFLFLQHLFPFKQKI